MALIIAFCLAVGLALIPMWGSMRRDVTAMNLAPTLAVAVALFVAVAFALLAVSFLQDDFTVAVVAAIRIACYHRYLNSPHCGVTTRAHCCCGC